MVLKMVKSYFYYIILTIGVNFITENIIHFFTIVVSIVSVTRKNWDISRSKCPRMALNSRIEIAVFGSALNT